MTRSHLLCSLLITVTAIIAQPIQLCAVEHKLTGIRLLDEPNPRRPVVRPPVAAPPAASPGEENIFAFGPAIPPLGLPLNQTFGSAYVPPAQPRPKQYHSMWTVKIAIRDSVGNYGQAVCYISTHTFDGTQWINNPAGLAQLEAEEQRLRSLGWFPFNRHWEGNHFQLRD
jgi:hypothetical protein